MSGDSDCDHEIDATAGVSGEAFVHRAAAYGDLSLCSKTESIDRCYAFVDAGALRAAAAEIYPASGTQPPPPLFTLQSYLNTMSAGGRSCTVSGFCSGSAPRCSRRAPA